MEHGLVCPNVVRSGLVLVQGERPVEWGVVELLCKPGVLRPGRALLLLKNLIIFYCPSLNLSDQLTTTTKKKRMYTSVLRPDVPCDIELLPNLFTMPDMNAVSQRERWASVRSGSTAASSDELSRILSCGSDMTKLLSMMHAMSSEDSGNMYAIAEIGYHMVRVYPDSVTAHCCCAYAVRTKSHRAAIFVYRDASKLCGTERDRAVLCVLLAVMHLELAFQYLGDFPETIVEVVPIHLKDQIDQVSTVPYSNFTAAIRFATRAIESLDPGTTPKEVLQLAYHVRGMATRHSASDEAEAIPYLSKAVDLGLEDAVNYYWLGRLLFQSGKYEEALRFLALVKRTKLKKWQALSTVADAAGLVQHCIIHLGLKGDIMGAPGVVVEFVKNEASTASHPLLKKIYTHIGDRIDEETGRDCERKRAIAESDAAFRDLMAEEEVSGGGGRRGRNKKRRKRRRRKRTKKK